MRIAARASHGEESGSYPLVEAKSAHLNEIVFAWEKERQGNEARREGRRRESKSTPPSLYGGRRYKGAKKHKRWDFRYLGLIINVI